jgi:hypothetical protein
MGPRQDLEQELEGKFPPLSPFLLFVYVLVLLHQAFFYFFFGSSAEGDSSNALCFALVTTKKVTAELPSPFLLR